MGTTMYYEETHFPPDGRGRANMQEAGTMVEVLVTNFFGDHQIFLKLTDGTGKGTEFHLTKGQAQHLAESLSAAESSIGYDNEQPLELN